MYLFEFEYVSFLVVLIFDYLFLVLWFFSEEFFLIYFMVGIIFNCCFFWIIWIDVFEGFFAFFIELFF